VALGLSASVARAQSLRPVPPLTGPVVDQAGLLDPAGRAPLEALALSARGQDEGRGVQLQFLLVPDLGGEPIESFSIRVAEAWKIGTKGKDNGLLFVVARDEHRARIEVGGGLEGELTDARSGQIIRETIVPAFRAGQYGAGLQAAALQALAAVGVTTAERAPPLRRSSRGLSGPVMLLFILPLLLLSLLGRKRRYGYGPWIGGGWSGGSGFGGGGGGWGGGGGGFSGGGASGSW
jgi:uncharacterized protein